ncbi:MAG: heme d1 biosynthesis protein [Firmicutes bacterium]|nr:heme d1 biosynthesis protein [Bacillota bacterium]
MTKYCRDGQRKFLLQWHITYRCNCRCTHCYQENHIQNAEPDREMLTVIIEQFKALLCNVDQGNGAIRGQITITGGEPFIREDFFDLLTLLASNRQYFDFAILTNGTLINRDIARRLKDLQPLFVQVSMEGVENTHNKIRGVGNYQQTVEAIQQLVQAGVRTFISFTAHRENFREFAHVAEVGRKLKVDKIWADRHIPMGQGVILKKEMLTREETREFFTIMNNIQKQFSRRWFTKTKVSLERGLQFLVGGGRPYHCAAGNNLIAVMPNGDVYPCRRMPIKVGNLVETSLQDIYYASPVLLELRDPPVSVGCEECMYGQICGGGLACLTYATYGRNFIADPGCWYANR